MKSLANKMEIILRHISNVLNDPQIPSEVSVAKLRNKLVDISDSSFKKIEFDNQN